MTDTKSDLSQVSEKANSLWIELGPTIAFILVYNLMLRFGAEGLFSKENALYWATGVLMAGTLMTVSYLLIKGRKIPPFLIVSSALIGSFGAVGIIWQSKLFLFIKPTIMNLLYAGMIFGGLAVGRNIWKMLFDGVFALPDFAWRTLAIRWGFFFIAMAIWNEVLWRNFSEATWANWKLGNMVIVLIWGALNVPYTMKHWIQDEDETADKTPPT